MLQESSQTQPCDELMRAIEDDMEDQKLKKQRIEQDEGDGYDHEREQLKDDIRYEDNAATDRIIEAFGSLFHDGNNSSGESPYYDNSDYYVYYHIFSCQFSKRS
jgi:hypothetical protein